MSLVAGLCSGMLSMSCGIVLNPLLLSLGMLPSVSAATKEFVALIISFSVSILFMVNL